MTSSGSQFGEIAPWRARNMARPWEIRNGRHFRANSSMERSGALGQGLSTRGDLVQIDGLATRRNWRSAAVMRRGLSRAATDPNRRWAWLTESSASALSSSLRRLVISMIRSGKPGQQESRILAACFHVEHDRGIEIEFSPAEPTRRPTRPVGHVAPNIRRGER